ncbi:MAG TPA: hypothetical protein VK149_06160 [Sideroxyarcus sp.]|nr:hypothetical protein [Sideroxyarcus sp.]
MHYFKHQSIFARGIFAILLGIFLIGLNGCATTTYGNQFTQTSNPNEFTVKIYTSAFTTAGMAEENAKEEAKKKMAQDGYSSYQIMNRRFNMVPSYYEFTLRFSRDMQRKAN